MPTKPKPSKDEATIYLTKLRRQVKQRQRRQRPAYPFEQRPLEKLAAQELSPLAYRAALKLWRELALLHKEVVNKYATYQTVPHHHKAYTELLWWVAPLLIYQPRLTKAIAEEVISEPFSWLAGGRHFVEALQPFFEASDLPGLDYELLWKANHQTTAYIAVNWRKDWPAHRPISWASALLHLERPHHTFSFFNALSGPDLSAVLCDIDPKNPPAGLDPILRCLAPEQWATLSRPAAQKLLQIKDPVLRLFIIGQVFKEAPSVKSSLTTKA